ncbi:MAG: PAS domain S-box protein [bacterium]
MSPNIDKKKIIIPEGLIQKWQGIVDVLAEYIKVPAALIMKLDSPYMGVLCSYESENNPYKTGEKRYLADLYCHDVIMQKDELCVPNALNDKRWHNNPDVKLGMIAYLGIPLLWPDEEAFGTICVLDSKERQFNKADKGLMLYFQNLIQTHLGSLSEQGQKSKELEKSEKLYLALYESANDAIFLMDFDRFIDCNPKTSQMFGWKKRQLMGKHPYDPFLSPPEQPDGRDSKEKALDKIKLAFEGKPQYFEWRHLRDGIEAFWVEVSLNRVEFAGKRILLAICRDITERKETEEAIHENEERFDLVLKGGELGLWDWDIQTGKVVRNERTAEIFGCSIEEMKPNVNMWESHIHPDDKIQVLEERNKHFAGQIPLYEAEYRLRTKSGDWKWILGRGKVVKRDKNGNPLRITGTLLDITNRKTAEQRLREERDKAQQFLDIAGVMIIVIHTDHKVCLINKKGCQILGYDEKEIIGKNWFESFIPKRVCNQVKVTFKKLMTGETEYVEYFENPVLTKNGEERLISWHNVLLHDKEGRVTGSLSSGEDITNRKRAEDALRKSENKYRTLVKNLPQKIFLKDTNSVYISCNENYAKDLKMKPDEIPGKTDYDFFPKKLAEKYRTDDQRIIRSGKTEGLEERYIQDGKNTWIYTLKTPVKDENGHIIGILGIFWDITERKKSQQALEAFAKELGKQKKSLEEKNIALREVLGQLEVEKRKMQEDIIKNIDELIIPIVKRLQLKGVSQEYITLLERNLKEITSSFGRKITQETNKLTSKEIEICSMIKNGLASKEISNLLNISFQTVVKHRKNIRKKLHISKKDINLYSYLQQF